MTRGSMPSVMVSGGVELPHVPGQGAVGSVDGVPVVDLGVGRDGLPAGQILVLPQGQQRGHAHVLAVEIGDLPSSSSMHSQ